MARMIIEGSRRQVEAGLDTLVRVQMEVSKTVPGALDGSRRTIVDYAYALTEEVHEVVREVGWKPWKEGRVPNADRVIEEMGDVLAFLGVLSINLALACGLDPSEFSARVAAQYEKTSRRNANRFVNGVEK